VIFTAFSSGILGGLVGGRLAYVIYDWDYFVANPRSIIGFEGLAQNGMIIGVIAAALIYMGVNENALLHCYSTWAMPLLWGHL
jgi:prolipoprotein diacylglyceryltransferase